MQIEKTEIEALAGKFGDVVTARNDLAALIEDAADSDLSLKLEALDTAIDAFKSQVAQKLQAADVEIVQEGDTSRAVGESVTIPASVSCEC